MVLNLLGGIVLNKVPDELFLAKETFKTSFMGISDFKCQITIISLAELIDNR